MAESDSKTDKSTQVFKVISVIILVLVIVSVLVLLALYLVTVFCGSIYLTYEDGIVYSINSGVEFTSGDSTTFTVKNAYGWGLYSVEQTNVKVLPNVEAGSTYDFSFTVVSSGETEMFSDVEDLSAAFTSNESGVITVDSEGCFDIEILYKDMEQILSAAYGSEVSGAADPDLSAVPYFKIVVTSPDEDDVIEVPFEINVIPDSIILDKTYIIF